MIHGRTIPYQGERIVSDLEVQRRLVWLPEASATATHSRHTEVELHTSSSESEPSCETVAGDLVEQVLTG